MTRPFLLGDISPSAPLAAVAAAPEAATPEAAANARRDAQAWMEMEGITIHNLQGLDARVPQGVLTALTGVSGSGKSSLLHMLDVAAGGTEGTDRQGPAAIARTQGFGGIDRVVQVDQRPIGRTPRSNLATYTGMFDGVRREFAATDEARARGFGAARFSFNIAGGRCETCQGEGSVAVELLFLPGSYGPCPVCHGSRFNEETLAVTYKGKNIAEVLALTVDSAAEALADIPSSARSLATLREVGLGYLRLGQPATELSGGEAQRIKLATELQRPRRGHTLYLLDEPTTGLHPADVQLLMHQLNRLVDAGNTVVVVEHDMDVVAAVDWVIDLGPAGGADGGRIMSVGTPEEVAAAKKGRTSAYLSAALARP